jgi:hypothetical protein
MDYRDQISASGTNGGAIYTCISVTLKTPSTPCSIKSFQQWLVATGVEIGLKERKKGSNIR